MLESFVSLFIFWEKQRKFKHINGFWGKADLLFAPLNVTKCVTQISYGVVSKASLQQIKDIDHAAYLLIS